MLNNDSLRSLATRASVLGALILGACPAPAPSGTTTTTTGTGSSTDSGTDTTDTSTDAGTDTSMDTDTDTDTGADLCGNGVVEADEVCDDGNDDNFDSCTELCQPPACDDGIWSTGETDLDCGGICDEVCDDGQMCNQVDDCVSTCVDGACVTALSCADLLAHDPDTITGLHIIDPDGDAGPIDPYMVYCEMGEFMQAPLDGGGWTLVMSVVDDGVDSFTWTNHEIFTTDTTTFGQTHLFLEADFKGATYHDLTFTDLMFFHTPSGTYAVYNDVGDGTETLGEFIAAQPFPNCDPSSGYALTEGPSILSSNNLDNLCSTDLYFNCGDYDGASQAACEANQNSNQAPTFGPCWSRAGNNGCPLDDPTNGGMGPIFGADPATHDQEANGLGYGFALGLNPSEGLGDGMTSFAMYVR